MRRERKLILSDGARLGQAGDENVLLLHRMYSAYAGVFVRAVASPAVYAYPLEQTPETCTNDRMNGPNGRTVDRSNDWEYLPRMDCYMAVVRI